MMKEDIAPELIKSVNKDFEKNIDNDTVKSLEEKAAQGKASYEDAYKYAEKIGEARSKALQGNVTPEALPDGKMYYNIADRLMNDSLSTDHDMVAEYAAKAQEAANRKAGIGLKAQKADLEQDRIDSFVNGLCGPEGFPIEEVAWKMGEPVVTHARTVVDSTIKKNAEFQHKAGIRATVTRKAAPRCCDWCTDLEGDYTYPNVPREVFQRHDRCKCTVDYEGKRLQAYNSGASSHSFRDGKESNRIEERKLKAAEKEAFLEKYIAERRKNGIIKSRRGNPEPLRIPQIPASTISDKIKSGEYSLQLSQQSYDKHVPGTQTYDAYLKARENKGLCPQSVLTISREEAQEIINRLSGTGIIKPRRDGRPTNVEQISCGKTIGYYYQNGKQVPTKKAAIHHGRKGSHIVPIKGNHYD